MIQPLGSISKYPARAAMIWYFSLIIVGSILLFLPFSNGNSDQPISWMDACFTSTSASCVTGLAVRSTGHDFSVFGQCVILALIQLSGIGIMTVTTFITLGWRTQHSLREKAIVVQTLGTNPDSQRSISWILKNVLGFTFLIEGIGFLLLAVRNLFYMPIKEAVWSAFFHSISAFCNAGFSIYDDSLVQFRGDIWVNGVIAALIVLGGLGFPVIFDIYHHRSEPKATFWRKLHLHSKLMIIGTIVLLVTGFASVMVIEWYGVLNEFPLWEKILVSMFHSASLRTAGFNTIDLASLSHAMLFVSILFMMVGAGPCSTGGGFKVSTLMTMLAKAWSTVRGMPRITLFQRSIPEAVVSRSMVTAFLFGATSIIALTLLLISEQSHMAIQNPQMEFRDFLFEVVSALGTVGLSTGLTGDLSTTGRTIIIFLMYLGRIGPIAVIAAICISEQRQPIEMPSEEPLIG